MNFLSSVNSILNPVADTLTTNVGNASSKVEELTSVVQDDVTAALSGELASENAGMDTFTATATSEKEVAQALDEQFEANQTNLTANSEAISAADGMISEYKTQISACDEQIKNLQAQLNNLQAMNINHTKDAAISQLGSQISGEVAKRSSFEAKLNEKTTEKEKLEAEKAQLEAEKTAIEEGGAAIQNESNGTAGNGNQTSSDAEKTASTAEQHKNEVIAERERIAAEEARKAQEAQQAAAAQQAAQTEEAPVAEEAAPAEVEPEAEVLAEEAPVAQEVQEKIDNNEITDTEMANVIINDYFGEKIEGIGEQDLVGKNADKAIEEAAEAQKVQMYSESVYTTKISKNTDTATIDENREAMSDFMAAFDEASSKVNNKIEFLSLTDKTNFENISNIAEKLNNGEYILTNKIEKATSTAQSIEISADETQISESTLSKSKGEELLAQLKDVITEDAEAKEDENDDILTQKEYEKTENLFNSTSEYTEIYNKMVEDAEKYGIYALAA